MCAWQEGDSIVDFERGTLILVYGSPRKCQNVPRHETRLLVEWYEEKYNDLYSLVLDMFASQDSALETVWDAIATPNISNDLERDWDGCCVRIFKGTRRARFGRGDCW